MGSFRVRRGMQAVDQARLTEAFADALVDQLLALDPTADVHGALTSGELWITVSVEVEDPFEAVERARALIRAAAHAAGAGTAGWPVDDDVWSWLRPTGSLHADPAESLVAP